MKNFTYPILFLFLISCQQGTSTEQTSNEGKAKELKPLAELSYSDIVNAVFSDNGEPIEYHGQPTNTEAITEVTLTVSDTERCGERDCGQKVHIKNLGEKKVKVLTYSPFKVGTMESHASKIITLDAGQTQLLGCSQFCYDGETYAFDHKIAGAEYLSE